MMLFQILLCLMVVTCVQGQTPVLLMQGRQGSSTFQFSASYWTNANTLGTQYSSPRTNVDAKLAAFNTMDLQGIKLCIGSSLPGICYEYPMPNAPQTALALFSGPHVRTTDLDQSTWNSMTRNTNRRSPCGMQRPGFNTRCNDRNWARWGYCDNIPSQGCQPNDGQDADRVIGLGLLGQSGTSGSAGVIGYPRQNAYGPSRQFWLYGLQAVDPAVIALQANVTSLASSLVAANARLAQVNGVANGAVTSIAQANARLDGLDTLAAGAVTSIAQVNTVATGAVASISQLDTRLGARLDAVAGKLASVAAGAVSDISLERPNTTNVNTTDVGVQDPQISTDNGDVVIEPSPGKALRLGGIADVEHDLNVAMARIDRLEQLLANAL